MINRSADRRGGIKPGSKEFSRHLLSAVSQRDEEGAVDQPVDEIVKIRAPVRGHRL